MTLSARMASTLRLFTRGGKEETFSTSLVEDMYSRPLRALVDGGFLTMDYTGTRRVYTLTTAGRDYLGGKRMGRKKQDGQKGPGQTREAQEAPGRPAEKQNDQGEATKRRVATANQRKKPRGDGAPASRMTPAQQVRGSVPMSPLDVIRVMREVRDYADAHEGVDALLAIIKRVEEIGQRFGGLDYVRESLEAIKEFRQEK